MIRPIKSSFISIYSRFFEKFNFKHANRPHLEDYLSYNKELYIIERNHRQLFPQNRLFCNKTKTNDKAG